MKVQAESFHLNGHIIGFHPQTQKLESSHKTLSSTLAVKGLILLSQLVKLVSKRSLGHKRKAFCSNCATVVMNEMLSINDQVSLP